MEFTGTVAKIGEPKDITEKFSKRNLLLEKSDGDYTNQYLFEFCNKHMELLNPLREGMVVTIQFDLGRANQSKDGRWFSNPPRGWRVGNEHSQEEKPADGYREGSQKSTAAIPGADDVDSVPF